MKPEEKRKKLKDLEAKLKQLTVEAAHPKSSPGAVQNGFENFIKTIFQRYE